MLLSLCCSVVIMLYCYFVVLLLFVLSYVLIVCTVPLPPGVSPIAVDKYINDHPPSSIAEVKWRVELYFYSPSESSWPVLGWNLMSPPFFMPKPKSVQQQCIRQPGNWNSMSSTGKCFYLFHSIDNRPFFLIQFPILKRSYAVGTPPHFDNAPPLPTLQLLAKLLQISK